MTFNVNNHSGKKMILYGSATNTQTERVLNPYSTKAIFNTINIYGETIQSETDYFDIEIDNLKQVKTNHIDANKKRNICFLCGDALYIPYNKVIDFAIKETRKEYQKGCISVSYDEILTFDNDIKVIYRDSFFTWKKGTDAINKEYKEEAENLADAIAKARETKSLFDSPKIKASKERLIQLYESKIKEGFDYICWCYHAVKKTTNKIYFSMPTHHKEKSKEYQHAEKVLNVLNSCCYSNDKLSIYEVIKMLDKCNITIKRKA